MSRSQASRSGFHSRINGIMHQWPLWLSSPHRVHELCHAHYSILLFSSFSRLTSLFYQCCCNFFSMCLVGDLRTSAVCPRFFSDLLVFFEPLSSGCCFFFHESVILLVADACDLLLNSCTCHCLSMSKLASRCEPPVSCCLSQS